ncbi:hypothetical protein BU23DRAFT_490916 [Bimuria novae-zelandiae CBS 107.79]|uniref:Secreted protein n=1 Tax=Bimuria novae-zelandiae CBS 107.79 TaxID=1447943 RepID=A0A6A5UJS3_9PLEO|nr:hypothetical protein BU23DRAFT_490916 [Bimuria novae-zelandiae CBS 107.79]
MLFFLALLACISSVVAAPAPAATVTRPPKGAATVGAVKVDNPDLDSEGNGCRAGSVGAAFASDNSALTLIFDDFQAAIGPAAGDLRKRAFCRVNVTLTSPGWAFDVSSVDFRSYVNIAKGVDVSLVSRWKWIDKKGVDMEGKGNVKKVLSGPFQEDFLLHNKDGELSDSQQSVCSKASATFQLSISATLSASGSSLPGLVQGSAADAKFGQLLNLTWRKC